MSKIVRFNGNLVAFASEQLGSERTLFGQVTSANDLTSQFTPEFRRGWGIVGPSDQPSLQDFNAVSYTNGQLIAYLHQMGVAEYNAAQEYYSGSITQTGGALYISLVDANTGNPPGSSPAQWRPFLTSVPDATTTIKGIVELATTPEAVAGTDTMRAVTPSGLKAAIDSSVAAAPIFGLRMANNATTPNTTIDVGAGSITTSDGAFRINLASLLRGILQSAGSWAAGDNQNKLDAGARASNTWYHVFAIRKTSDGTGDILFSLSATAPTMPVGYSGFALIESVRTDASGNIRAFIESDTDIRFITPVIDQYVASTGTAKTNYTISVPPGRRVNALIDINVVGNDTYAYVASPEFADVTPLLIGASYGGGIVMSTSTAPDYFAVGYEVVTDASSQMSVRCGSASSLTIVTKGWRKRVR